MLSYSLGSSTSRHTWKLSAGSEHTHLGEQQLVRRTNIDPVSPIGMNLEQICYQLLSRVLQSLVLARGLPMRLTWI